LLASASSLSIAIALLVSIARPPVIFLLFYSLLLPIVPGKVEDNVMSSAAVDRLEILLMEKSIPN
jgi:hypothetical protein